MTINFQWVKPQTSRAANPDVLTGKTVKSGIKGDGTRTFQFVLIIPESLMRKARLVIGDRVTVGFAVDDERRQCVAIRRVLSGGYTICTASGGSKGASEEARGKILRARVSTACAEFTPSSFSTANGGYEVDGSGMLIAWEGGK